MNKYVVGYAIADDPIGTYYGETEEQAIRECKEELSWARNNGYKDGTLTPRERLVGLVAYKVDY